MKPIQSLLLGALLLLSSLSAPAQMLWRKNQGKVEFSYKGDPYQSLLTSVQGLTNVVTSVNGQSGAVNLTIPTSATQIGGVLNSTYAANRITDQAATAAAQSAANAAQSAAAAAQMTASQAQPAANYAANRVSDQAATAAAQNTASQASAGLGTHVANTNNPHATTKAQVGLGNVKDLDQTNPANIVQSSSFRFVTDSQIAGWNSGSGGGAAPSNPFFDVVFPATVAELNTAIAGCIKPALYVVGKFDINQMIVVNNKTKLAIIGLATEVTLTSWNDGTQGIMVDFQGTITDVKITGFKFNCPLPSSAGDGGGYAMMVARGAVCPSIDGLVIEDCYFTCPNLHQNAISLICVGWGGFGTRTNVTIRRCVAENVKRFFVEVHNQEVFDTDATPRYSNIVIEQCRAKNLGAGGVKSTGVATDGGMFASFDGAGEDNKVVDCIVTNPFFAAYEAVGTRNVKFINCVADFEPGYAAPFVGYSFTDGNHGAAFGPKRITVSGGHVRCTGRGYNLTEAKDCRFYDVTFKSNQGNTLVRTTGNEFRKCDFIGVATKQALHYFNAAHNNVFTHGYLGNEGVPDDQTGGRCTIVFDNGSSGNRLFYLDHFQEQRTNGDGAFYEATLLDFSGGTTNQVLHNQSNNPSPGF